MTHLPSDAYTLIVKTRMSIKVPVVMGRDSVRKLNDPELSDIAVTKVGRGVSGRMLADVS